MDKKNLIIAVLAGLLVLGSLWGQVGNKESKALRHELEQAERQLSTVETTNSQTHDAVLTKTADLQKTLQGKEKQLTRARKELVSLRKANKGLEAKLSERDAAVQKLMNEKKQLPADAQNADSGRVAELEKQVAELEKQNVALRENLKKKRPKSGRTQSAVIVQLAAAQKQVIALQKELKNKEKLLAQKPGVSGSGQADDGLKKIASLQAELKKKDGQLAQAQNNAAAQISALEDKLAALQQAPQEKVHEVAPVLEGVTPVQAAFFQSVIKKKNMQLRHAHKIIAKLQKQGAVLQVQAEKQGKEGTAHSAGSDNQVAALHKKIASLQAELEKRNTSPGLKQFVRIQDHTSVQVDESSEKLAALQAELKKKDKQIAGLQQNHVSDQVIKQLQKNMDGLRNELKRRDEMFAKARNAWSAQVTDLQKKLQCSRQEGARKGKGAEAVNGQAVALLQKNLAAVKARNQELEQAVKKAQVSQGQSVDSHELETAKAQIIGLEKIVEEKNAVIEETSSTLDRVKINMDVLLNKIGDLQAGLQKVREANRELVKELTVKNEELAQLQKQVQEAPAE